MGHTHEEDGVESWLCPDNSVTVGNLLNTSRCPSPHLENGDRKYLQGLFGAMP